MSITLKTKQEIAILREGGRRLASILKIVSDTVKPGVSSQALNDLAFQLIKSGGDEPTFLNYTPYGAKRPFPAALCVSVNDEVVHGIPNEKIKILKAGDIVSLDIGLIHQGLITDMAVTVPVGRIDKRAEKLLLVTKGALKAGIESARLGKTVGDISFAVESFVKSSGANYGIVEELAGHGVGYKIHEDPYVPNYGKAGTGPVLKSGMVIAIEPMINEGSKKVTLSEDGYTVHTSDGQRSAHFEHTVAITNSDPLVLTEI